MIFVGLLAGLLTIFCAGYGITALILRTPNRLNALELGAMAWLLGSGMVSLLLWIFGIWISGLSLQATVTASCLAVGISGWQVSRRTGVTFRWPRPANSIEWFLAGVIAFQIAMMFLMSFKSPLGWDGLLIWEIKARYAFLNGGALPAAYYADSTRVFTHPDYPLYLSFTELWLYIWMGEAHQFWIKLVFPIYYAAGAILLAATGARLSGRRWAGGLAAALLFFVPFLTTTGYGGILHGYADFPLSVFYLAALSYLLLFLRWNDANFLRLYFLVLALLPWIKREGSILWAVAALCGALALWRRKRAKRWLLCLLPALFGFALWQLFLNAVHAPRPREFSPVSLSVLFANADRIPPILRGLCAETLNIQRWSLFWPMAVAAFLYLVIRARDVRLGLLSLAVFTPVAAYCGTYLFSEWEDYQAHIGTSLSRLLLQVVPVAWLAIALALRGASPEEGRPFGQANSSD